jgi:hypothetical protein
MANDLLNMDDADLPVGCLTLASPDFSATLAFYVNHLDREGRDYFLRAPVSKDHRAALRHRGEEIRRFMLTNGVAAKSRIQEDIAIMLGLRNASRNVSERDAAMLIAGMVTATLDIPHYFVKWACDDFIKGSVPNDDLRFPPNVAQFRQHALSLMARFSEELSTIKNILRASYRETVSDDQREKVAGLLAGLAAQLKANAVLDKNSDYERARSRQAQRDKDNLDRTLARAREHHGVDAAENEMASPYLTKQLTGQYGKPKPQTDEHGLV